MTQYELKKTDEVRKAALLHDSNRCKSAKDVSSRAQMHFPAAQVTDFYYFMLDLFIDNKRC